MARSRSSSVPSGRRRFGRDMSQLSQAQVLNVGAKAPSHLATEVAGGHEMLE
jgi:hypothetical protein